MCVRAWVSLGDCVCQRQKLEGWGCSLLLLGDKAVNKVASEDVNQSLCGVMNAPVIMIIHHKGALRCVYMLS